MNRTALLLVPVLLLAGSTTACAASTGKKAAKTESQEQAQDSSNLVNNQPIPGFTYSQIRQNLIELETAQAQGVQTTSFFFNQGVADPIFSCPSIGAPIPTTDQLSNPMQTTKATSGSNGVALATLGQMDPDGVYTGDSTGTYVMCVGADGKPYADYWEGFVSTVFGAAKWNSSSHQVQLVGAPSFQFSGGKKAGK